MRGEGGGVERGRKGLKRVRGWESQKNTEGMRREKDPKYMGKEKYGDKVGW